MRTSVARALTALLLGGLVAASPAAAAAKPRATYIVQLRSGVSDAQGRALVRAAGGRVTGSVRLIHALAARLSAAGARALAGNHANVRALTINARVRPQDTGPDPSHLRSAYPWSVAATKAWPTATGAGVGVAVIDTGIAGDMPDFEGDDGSSRVVASAVTNPGATSANDTYGHGTHVAGIIAGDGTRRDASDPNYGRYIGIAPDADLVSVKAADDDGNATVLDVIYGLQFAVDHQADYDIRVVNLSLESTTAESYRTDPLDAAAESAYFHGILVVAAAGNRGTAADAGDYAPGNDPYVLSVGAVDDKGTWTRHDDALATWSSAGQTQDGYSKPDIAAPGAHIVSTLAPNSDFASLCPSCIVGGDYIRAGGTSMAAPVVSGVAAGVLQLHPDWTPEEVKGALLATAQPVSATSVREVNAQAAVALGDPPEGADDGLQPNELVDPHGGDIDYTRSSWSRSSWSTAAGELGASWARSSWSCTCGAGDGQVDPTRSSWSRSSWSTRWSY